MEEFGSLEGYEKNRYWSIRLPRSKFLITGSNWLYRLFWKILTLIMLIPLFLVAKYYGKRLKSNYEEDEGKDSTGPYRYFSEIYPGCVYSPFVKGYELELFKNCDMEPPILEIGMGDGYLSSLIFKSKKTKLNYGSDLIYGTIKSAIQYDHCENHVVMDAVEIPFPDNFLGTVVMNNLMHHLHDRSVALREVLRVLKNGGRFIFTDNTIGWGIFTWDQMLLRRLKLQRLADFILNFKLKLFAQRLLTDNDYYDKRSEEGGYKINRKVNFVSKSTMYLSSLFEFLNLKTGQPTRKEMVVWMNLFGLRKNIDAYLDDIIKNCCAKDREQTLKEGYAFQFFEVEKMGAKGPEEKPGGRSIPYVCPKCKKDLARNTNSFFCNYCNLEYPIADGIPILLSYQNKLREFNSYIKKKEKEEGEKFVT